MNKVIEDFSVKIPMVNPENNYHYTDYVDLKVYQGSKGLVIYTFNSYSENTAKQLFKALEKYKTLCFVTGVLGRTMNRIIQENMKKHMENLYGNRIKIEYGVAESYIYSIR